MEVSQLHSSAPLLPNRAPRAPLHGRLGLPQTGAGLFGEEKNLLSVPGIEA
jgi:hypothetical protein